MTNNEIPTSELSSDQPRSIYAIDRKIWDHPMFTSAPYTEREAWMWMIGTAAWRPVRVRVADFRVDLQRGELAFSSRFLAEKWRWSRARVRRFLERLQNEEMIAPCNRPTTGPHTSPQAAHQPAHVTICNYDGYQFGRPTTVQESGPPPERKAAQRRRSNNKEEREVRLEVASPSAQPLMEPGPSKRGTRLPEGWTPSPEGHLFAVELLGEAEAALELENFRDYWMARPGAGAVKLNWGMTWKGWCRKAHQWRSNGKRTNIPHNGNSVIEAADKLIEAAERGEFSFGPTPRLYPANGEDDPGLLPER